MRRKIVLVAVLLAGAAASNAQVSSHAAVSYQNYDSGFLTTTGVRQQYDLRLEKALSEMAQFRVSLRLEDFAGSNDSPGLAAADSKNHGRQFQPAGEFNLLLPTLQAQIRFDLLHAKGTNGTTESTRRLERTGGQLSWHPYGLPEVSIDGRRNRSYDGNTHLDVEDTSAQAGVGYEWRGLRVGLSERLSQYGDGRLDFVRRSQDHQGVLSYEQSFLDGKLSTTANVNGTLSRFEEHTAGPVTVSIPTRVSISRASFVVDDTPYDNRDRPLVALPALTDGSINASAGIGLGPDSPAYQNIAFDFSRFAEVDEIRVYIRNSSGNPVRTGGGVQWDVYRSDDGIVWTLVTGAQAAFDFAQSLYSVRFAQLTVRYLKVVTFGAEVDQAFVTETEAYYHTLLAPNRERTTDSTLYSGTTAVSYRPVRWLSVAYGGLFNSSNQQQSGRPPQTTRDADHVGSLEVTPWSNLSVTGRFDSRTLTQNGSLSQTLESMTGIVRYLPLARLDFSFETTRQYEDSRDRSIESDTSIVHVNARLLPTVDLRANFGVQKQDFRNTDRTAESRFMGAVLTAQLTRTLRVLLDSSTQRSAYGGTGGIVEGLPSARDDRQSAEFYWRAGRPLGLGVRLGRVTTDQLAAVTQRYRVEWYPFAQGTVSIGGTYDEDIDPYMNRKSTRIVFSPRWTMNRHTNVDLNYTFVDTTGTGASKNRSFYATLTLTN